jgi:hypothetical protein
MPAVVAQAGKAGQRERKGSRTELFASALPLAAAGVPHDLAGCSIRSRFRLAVKCKQAAGCVGRFRGVLPC